MNEAEKTFHFSFELTPRKGGEHWTTVKSAFGHVWAISEDGDPDSARRKAERYLANNDWLIENMVEEGRQTSIEHYENRPEYRTCFLRAQVAGVAVIISPRGILPDSEQDLSTN